MPIKGTGQLEKRALPGAPAAVCRAGLRIGASGEAGVQHRQQPPHDRLGSQSGRIELGTRFGASQLDHPHQAGDHLLATVQRTRTCGEALDDQQTGRGAVAVQEPEQRGQARAHPSQPRAAGAIGGSDNARRVLQGLLECRQEAVLAIVEDLIEGAPRHARAPDDVSDADVGGAALGDLLDHRGEHPCPLDLGYLAATARLATILAAGRHVISFWSCGSLLLPFFALAFVLAQPVTAMGVDCLITAPSCAVNAVGILSFVLHKFPLRRSAENGPWGSFRSN